MSFTSILCLTSLTLTMNPSSKPFLQPLPPCTDIFFELPAPEVGHKQFSSRLNFLSCNKLDFQLLRCLAIRGELPGHVWSTAVIYERAQFPNSRSVTVLHDVVIDSPMQHEEDPVIAIWTEGLCTIHCIDISNYVPRKVESLRGCIVFGGKG